jgi:hypothetical protein
MTVAEMEPIIAQCERDLIQQGFGNLRQLRQELKVYHPAWRSQR